jgi:hypothetical protein
MAVIYKCSYSVRVAQSYKHSYGRNLQMLILS